MVFSDYNSMHGLTGKPPCYNGIRLMPFGLTMRP